MTDKQHDEPYTAAHWTTHWQPGNCWMMVITGDAVGGILVGGNASLEVGADYAFRLVKVSNGSAYFSLARVRPWWKRLLRIAA